MESAYHPPHNAPESYIEKCSVNSYFRTPHDCYVGSFNGMLLKSINFVSPTVNGITFVAQPTRIEKLV
jgi:hypothetical protein